MIRVHITIPEEMDERIRVYGKENNLILSHSIRELINKGLDNVSISKKIDQSNTMIDKMFSRQLYIRDLIEQFYTDMEIENHLNPKNNKALQTFKSERYKDKYND